MNIFFHISSIKSGKVRGRLTERCRGEYTANMANEFGKTLDAILSAQDWALRDFAEEVRRTPRTLRNWRNGKHHPGREDIADILNVLKTRKCAISSPLILHLRRLWHQGKPPKKVSGHKQPLTKVLDVQNVSSCSGESNICKSSDESLSDLSNEKLFVIGRSNPNLLIHEWLVTPTPKAIELKSGPRIDDSLIAQFERRVYQLRRLDDFVGGRDLYLVVERELAAIMATIHRSSCNRELTRRLLNAAGELSQLAGWVTSDAGLVERATSHFQLGVKAAHSACNKSLGANLVSTLAYHWTNTGQPQEGLLAAQSALLGANNASATTRALLGERIAWAQANNGNRQESHRALVQVERDFSTRNPSEDPEWVYWLSEDEIATMAARCFLLLKEPKRAMQLLEGVVERYNSKHTREVALYTSWLAEASFLAGEIEAAVHYAISTTKLTVQTSSARGDDRVRTLYNQLSYIDSPIVSEFMDMAEYFRLM